MAKKKAAAKKTTAAAKPSPGLGKKYCPACDEIIAARSTTCPKCGHVIPPKNGKKPTKKKAAQAASSNGKPGPGAAQNAVAAVSAIRSAQLYVDAVGGYGPAIAILQAMGGNEVGNG